jgi:hypothetical protein
LSKNKTKKQGSRLTKLNIPKLDTINEIELDDTNRSKTLTKEDDQILRVKTKEVVI